MKYRRNFPDYALRYKEKTGRDLSELLHLSNAEIREEFHKLGLRRPSWAFLEYYRSLFKDPMKMAERINQDFINYLTSKLGIKTVEMLNILDTIIITGYMKLMQEKDFDIKLPELLKAIELKLKYKEEKPEDIEKKIEEILNGDRKEV